MASASKVPKFDSEGLEECFYCKTPLEAQDLDAHEKNCLFREVTCPKVNCRSSDWISFNGIMDHFQEEHPNVEIKHDVLDFKGTLEDLEKSTFVLNSYENLFFPQFHVEKSKKNLRHESQSMLYIWVRGHGNQTEINPFEMSIKFFLNGKPRIRMNDLVKAMDFTWDSFFTEGYGSMQIRVGNIMAYYDVESEKRQGQDFIEFEMKIVNEKLDEIEKDVNTESGVEDSESEEK